MRGFGLGLLATSADKRERESNRRAFYEEMKHAYAITREAAYLRAIGRLGGIYALKKIGLKLRKFR